MHILPLYSDQGYGHWGTGLTHAELNRLALGPAVKVLREIVNYLCGLRALAESLLLSEINRRHHMDELMIGIQRHHCLCIQPSRTVARQCIGRFNGGAN